MKHGVPSLLSIAVINVMTKKQHREEGVYLASAARSSWEVRAGTQAETVVNIVHWLVCQDFLNQLSYTTQAHPLRYGTTHRRLGSPTLVVNQENDPRTCPQANQMEKLSQKRVSLSR